MNWKKALISPHDTIKNALEAIGNSSIQLAIIVDNQERLLGIVTDGDIRRAFLDGKVLDEKIGSVMNTNPKTINNGVKKNDAIQMMREFRLFQIPVLDDNRKIVDVLLLDELIRPSKKTNAVVIMAGGLGQRLRPMTENCPKPMLQVGGKPILETIITQFKKFGFHKFYISVNYLSEVITDYFGDGINFDCDITYIFEKEKMGTAGALGLIEEKFEDPFFVMNGDLLTKVNYDQFLEFHFEKNAVATMGVRDYDFQIPYGVVNVKGHQFVGVDEKPIERYFVNAGIYLLDPSVLSVIEPEKPLGMTELFELLNKKGENSSVFPIREFWMDIGRPSDFKKANKEYDRFFK